MSTKRSKQYPYGVRDFVDSDYLKKLSDGDREYMLKFEDEYYGNQHREGEIHNDSEKYTEEMKSETDRQNNAARRDVYGASTRVTVRSNDLSSIIYDSYSEHISESVKIKGVERTVVELINDAAIDILEMPHVKEVKESLSKLCIDVTKAIQLEKKYRKNRRRKK